MRLAENTTCPQREYFKQAYHGKKRQLAALDKQLEALKEQKDGLVQEIAAVGKLAGLTDSR